MDAAFLSFLDAPNSRISHLLVQSQTQCLPNMSQAFADVLE